VVSELYEALRSVGVEASTAKAAAEAVRASDARTHVTKADLQIALAELKADLSRRQVYTLVAMTAIYGGWVTLLKVFG